MCQSPSLIFIGFNTRKQTKKSASCNARVIVIPVSCTLISVKSRDGSNDFTAAAILHNLYLLLNRAYLAHQNPFADYLGKLKN